MTKSSFRFFMYNFLAYVKFFQQNNYKKIVYDFSQIYCRPNDFNHQKKDRNAWINLNTDLFIKMPYKFIEMFDFANNYFLGNKTPKAQCKPSSPSNFRTKPNKKAACLYLEKILKSKINKQVSYGFGKIKLESLPKLPFSTESTFYNSTDSGFFSAKDGLQNATSQNSPKDTQNYSINIKSAKILKKRSSLNETRTIQTEKLDEPYQPNCNPERTYALPTQNEPDKQYDAWKMMQLSCETRTILQKVARMDKKIFTFQLQKLCKDQFHNQIKKLQKIKNSNKHLRSGQIYDNQLTMSVLYNNIKMISSLNKEIQQLIKQNSQNEKQLKMKRQQQIKIHKSNQKLSKHLGNIQSKLKVYTDRIDQHLASRQLNKAVIGINQFVKKYEGQQFAKQKIYFYNLIKDRIVDYNQIQKCLDEICRILGVLCMADLNQTDACLKSMSSNHTAFNYIKRTYGDINKMSGKQMLNILHNLQKFNNNIVKYLYAKKQIQKQTQKPTVIQQLKQQHNIQLNNLNTKITQYKRKIALLQNQILEKNSKISNIDNLTNTNQNIKKVQYQFQISITDILQKIANNKQYKKQLQNFRKNQALLTQKPYSQFINLTYALQRSYNQKIKKQIDLLSETLNQISKIFRKESVSQQDRFKQINNVLESSSRKNVFYFDLHRFLQSLMFTIIKNTKQDKFLLNIGEINSKVSQTKNKAPLQRKRNRRYTQNFDDLKFEIGTERGGKSCVDRKESPAKSVVCFNQQQQDIGDFNQIQLLKSLQLFLNKVSPILHNNSTKIQDRLTQIQHLSQKFIINNYKFKQFFTTIQNWMSFALPRLDKISTK